MITSNEAVVPNLPKEVYSSKMADMHLALFYDANNVQLNSFAENSCTEFKRAKAWFNSLRYYIYI